MQMIDIRILAAMLKSLDLEKNDKETIKEVLFFIADELEKFSYN